MINPLMEAIERLTNPYAMQERVYRNRVDEQEIVTPLEVIVIRDAAPCGSSCPPLALGARYSHRCVRPVRAGL